MNSSHRGHDQAQEQNGEDRGKQNEDAVKDYADNGEEPLTIFLKGARDGEHEAREMIELARR